MYLSYMYNFHTFIPFFFSITKSPQIICRPNVTNLSLTKTNGSALSQLLSVLLVFICLGSYLTCRWTHSVEFGF